VIKKKLKKIKMCQYLCCFLLGLCCISALTDPYRQSFEYTSAPIRVPSRVYVVSVAKEQEGYQSKTGLM
jgi:hypothetical protein